MTGSLVLVGGQPFQGGESAELKALAQLGVTSVAVIPTGAAYEDPGALIQASRTAYTAAGIEVTAIELLRRDQASDEGMIAEMAAADAVHLCGPSSMHLRSVLKDSAAWQALTSRFEKGAVMIASEAGAMVLCDPMVDPRGGAFTVGLGLLSGVTVIPKFDTWSEDAVHRTRVLSPKGVAVVGMTSDSALIRDGDGRFTAIGSVSVFRDAVSMELDGL